MHYKPISCFFVVLQNLFTSSMQYSAEVVAKNINNIPKNNMFSVLKQ